MLLHPESLKVQQHKIKLTRAVASAICPSHKIFKSTYPCSCIISSENLKGQQHKIKLTRAAASAICLALFLHISQKNSRISDLPQLFLFIFHNCCHNFRSL
jgi:hypothetical protein